MRSRIYLLALVLLAVFTTSSEAPAQSVAETASRWGLLGTWRLDCGKAPTRSDGDLQYVVRDGKLFHDRDFGDSKDSHSVVLATAMADGSIELIINFVSFSQTRQFSLMRGGDGRIRAVSNRNVDTDEYVIKDGKFAATGADTPWQTRCR